MSRDGKLGSIDIDLSLGLTGTHVLVTGGAGLIGSVIVKHFLAAGCRVSCIDIKASIGSHTNEPSFFEVLADVADEAVFQRGWLRAVHKFGAVECCVAAASLDLSVLKHHESLCDMTSAQWQRTLEVNVGGTFVASKSWLKGVQQIARSSDAGGIKARNNISLILIGSESGHFGEYTNADYAASKAAVQYGLLPSLKVDASRTWNQARVNVVAPGPVDTERFREECAARPDQFWEDAQATVAMRQPVAMESVARTVLFLASGRWAGHIHGQTINVDGGKQGKLVWSKEGVALRE